MSIEANNGLGLNSSQNLTNDIKRELAHIESLSVFFQVTLEAKQYTLNGNIFDMKINKSGEKKINLENSKKLMFGSLVVLSSDLFMSECLVGVISEQDNEKLEKGIIQVRFEHDLTSLNFTNTPEFQKVYTLVETTAYFEFYKHVLEALVSFKNCTDADFPFKKNLIDCQHPEDDQPEYLKNVAIDFRPIVDPNKKLTINKTTGMTSYEFSPTTEYASKCFISNNIRWPTAQNMKLDESQYKAVQLALTRKLALIQGPPGTGKTFIGVKIMELLLHNKELWWNRPGQPKRPILMICYTNHALDQFLNYCIDECHLNSGIIRVGGRCTSDKLKPFLLSEVKIKIKDSRRMKSVIFNQIKEKMSEFTYLQNKINQPLAIRNKVSSSCLINMQSLKEIVEPDIYRQFADSHLLRWRRQLDIDYSLLEWLGFFDFDETLLEEESFLKNSSENISTQQDQSMTLCSNKRDQDQGWQKNDASEVDDSDDLVFDMHANSERLLDDDLADIDVDSSVYSNYYLLDTEDLVKMCLRYYSVFGQRIMEYLTKDWKTVVKGSKKNTTIKNSPINQLINTQLEQILHSQIDLDEYENINKDNIFKLNPIERVTCYR